ncbi:hemerythrin domain-containing protein [Thiohalorhabdus denitrificans]|uniref:Hemerythrin HHE cation binding domain-containing protein n=1 Tax=Thiohalorhabdus denitrificans TaxID=381306 RepID=A0A1G5BUU1_9GAMM|nr:hemerythrin domain-containing protein [Thiohalorhabdus denitrificans]SCX93958.1 Hemerythrin HHE cation binding domain-containing protein [Thiohalorhabdus denitrificans]
MTAADQPHTLDLRDESRPRMAALAGVQQREEGQTLELLFAEEPSLLMQAVALMMRNRFHWEVAEADHGTWRVRVVDRDAVEPDSLTELLSRDHERLDRLFAIALQHANKGEVDAALPLVESCYQGLRRHIYCENDVLAPHFGIPEESPHGDPTNTMLHEHDNILQELAEIREMASLGEAADASMIAALMGILSGGLAKHEGREEQNLFPQWDAALRREPAPGLLERAKGILNGAEDDRLPE